MWMRMLERGTSNVLRKCPLRRGDERSPPRRARPGRGAGAPPGAASDAESPTARPRPRDKRKRQTAAIVDRAGVAVGRTARRADSRGLESNKLAFLFSRFRSSRRARSRV